MSRLWLAPTFLILLLLGTGLGGAYIELLAPGPGFYLFLGGGLLSATCAVSLAGAAAYASATGKKWRGAALRGSLVPLIITLVIVLPQANHPTPILNDISTDLNDPPQFQADVAALAAPMKSPDPAREQRQAQQQSFYPEIASLVLSDPPEASFERALALARTMEGWDVTSVDRAQKKFQVVATSALFHFKDDVVLRVRPDPRGSRIDLRSRSRIGRGDMGANAERILAFQQRFATR